MRCPSYPQLHQQQQDCKAEKLAPQFAPVAEGHHGGFEFLTDIEEMHPRGSENLADNVLVDPLEARLSGIDVYRKLVDPLTMVFKGPNPRLLQVGYRPVQTVPTL